MLFDVHKAGILGPFLQFRSWIEGLTYNICCPVTLSVVQGQSMLRFERVII